MIPEPEVLIDIPLYTHAALPETMDIVRHVHYVQVVRELEMRQAENRPEKDPSLSLGNRAPGSSRFPEAGQLAQTEFTKFKERGRAGGALGSALDFPTLHTQLPCDQPVQGRQAFCR